MLCPPQYRQRYICAYQPRPNSSEPSCGVSLPQSRQNRWNRSVWRPGRISLRQARCDAVHQSSSAAIMRCQRRLRPLRCGGGARPTWSMILRSVKGWAERAIIASSYETPISLHQPCQPDMCWRPPRCRWGRLGSVDYALLRGSVVRAPSVNCGIDPAEPYVRSPSSERLAPQSLILALTGFGRVN
jgi:hypothetical protein